MHQVPVFDLQPGMQPPVIRDLQVTQVGHLKAKEYRVHHRFTYHAVVVVISGHGDFRQGDGPVQEIAPGAMFAAYPGPVYHYGPPAGATWEECHVALHGRGLQRWQEFGLLPAPGSVRQLARPAWARGRFRGLLRVVNDRGTGWADRAVVLTEMLLLNLYYDQVGQHRQRDALAELDAVCEYCRNHLAEPIDFHTIARRSGMSYSLLRKRWRELTGSPPQRWLTILRCNHAKRLLANQELRIAQVAEAVGIPDPFSFSRVFRRHVGVSPRYYRDQLETWVDRP